MCQSIKGKKKSGEIYLTWIRITPLPFFAFSFTWGLNNHIYIINNNFCEDNNKFQFSCDCR